MTGGGGYLSTESWQLLQGIHQGQKFPWTNSLGFGWLATAIQGYYAGGVVFWGAENTFQGLMPPSAVVEWWDLSYFSL